jgi:YedE family putative selenium metabolism protein
MKKFFASRYGIIFAGCAIGVIAALLQFMGNPPNMGVCVACFARDIAGSVGLHKVATLQYMRPEIAGFVLGAFGIAIISKEYKPRGGSAPLIRFFLGVFAAFGALIFLGCPWRTILRLAGGDGNALFGFLGLFTGVGLGVTFLKQGFTLGRAYPSKKAAGWVFPAVMLALLGILIAGITFGENGPLFASAEGPGSKHSAIWISIAAGLVIGVLAQRSRFCTVGALRDTILVRDFHLFFGVIAMLAAALVMNLVLGQFNPGFENQPIAHTEAFWNFAGMGLAGLAFVLAGGCPGRQLILSGEGDSDAAVFVLGLIAGAAIAHNFSIASSAKGVSQYGPAAVVVGVLFCCIIGLTMRERVK